MNDNETINQISNFLKQSSAHDLKELSLSVRTFFAYYRAALLEVETKFNVLNEEFSVEHDRNPIDSIKTRIKSFESIQRKLNKKNLPLNLECIQNNIFDIAGIRIICPFVNDIYMLAECLEQQDDITIIKCKDYIKNPKPNGYRSLHLIVQIPIFLKNEKRNMCVEVQLRTIAMEFWANLEHQIRYKKDLDESVLTEISSDLSDIANIINLLDDKMQSVRDFVDNSTKK